MVIIYTRLGFYYKIIVFLWSQNFPEDFRSICPYNATHRLPESEMLAHVNDCPARQFAQPELYHSKFTYVIYYHRVINEP